MSTPTPNKQLTVKAHTLLTQLLSNPIFSIQLQKIHDLALYESGDALLGEEEKEALLNVKIFSELLKELTEDDLDSLRAIL